MTSDACLFCKILKGAIPSQKVLETEHAYAFRDIKPVAPTHVLVIPKKHIVGVATVEPGDGELVGHVFLAAQRVAREAGLEQDGYRLVVNHGEDAGQTVFHLHVHVLGGRSLSWPPG